MLEKDAGMIVATKIALNLQPSRSVATIEATKAAASVKYCRRGQG